MSILRATASAANMRSRAERTPWERPWKITIRSSEMEDTQPRVLRPADASRSAYLDLVTTSGQSGKGKLAVGVGELSQPFRSTRQPVQLNALARLRLSGRVHDDAADPTVRVLREDSGGEDGAQKQQREYERGSHDAPRGPDRTSCHGFGSLPLRLGGLACADGRNHLQSMSPVWSVSRVNTAP